MGISPPAREGLHVASLEISARPARFPHHSHHRCLIMIGLTASPTLRSSRSASSPRGIPLSARYSSIVARRPFPSRNVKDGLGKGAVARIGMQRLLSLLQEEKRSGQEGALSQGGGNASRAGGTRARHACSIALGIPTTRRMLLYKCHGCFLELLESLRDERFERQNRLETGNKVLMELLAQLVVPITN